MIYNCAPVLRDLTINLHRLKNFSSSGCNPVWWNWRKSGDSSANGQNQTIAEPSYEAEALEDGTTGLAGTPGAPTGPLAASQTPILGMKDAANFVAAMAANELPMGSPFVTAPAWTCELECLVETSWMHDENRKSCPGRPGVLLPPEVEFDRDLSGNPVLLGQGCWGKVYRGRMTRDNRPVAIKVDGQNGRNFAQAYREASIQTHLNPTRAAPYCHGLLQLREVDTASGGWDTTALVDELPVAIVMDLVASSGPVRACSLQDLLGTGKISWKQWRRLIAELCRKVHAIHQKGVIINDIKPDNVLIMYTTGWFDEIQDFELYVIDFGLANYGYYGTHPFQVDYTTFRTRHCHLAPERFLQNVCSVVSDVYSVGMLLWRVAYDMGFCAEAMFWFEQCTMQDPKDRWWDLTQLAEGMEDVLYWEELEKNHRRHTSFFPTWAHNIFACE